MKRALTQTELLIDAVRKSKPILVAQRRVLVDSYCVPGGGIPADCTEAIDDILAIDTALDAMRKAGVK